MIPFMRTTLGGPAIDYNLGRWLVASSVRRHWEERMYREMYKDPEYIVLHKEHGLGATDSLWEFKLRGSGDNVQDWLLSRNCPASHYQILSIALEHEIVSENAAAPRRFGVRIS